MKRGDHIMEELAMMDAPILRSLSGHMPYVVPAGYFETVSHQVTLRIMTELEPEITASMTRNLPYQVPAAYFEQLPDAIMGRIAAEDTLNVEMSVPNAFTVPDQYFEKFPEQVIEHIRAEELRARTAVQRPKKVPLFHNLRLAASVALIICAGFGILRINNNMGLRPATAKVDFNTVPRDAISAYVIQNIDDFDTELIVSSMGNGEGILDPALDNNASKAEIEAYLNEDGWN